MGSRLSSQSAELLDSPTVTGKRLSNLPSELQYFLMKTESACNPQDHSFVKLQSIGEIKIAQSLTISEIKSNMISIKTVCSTNRKLNLSRHE
jgi:hypothetical protein